VLAWQDAMMASAAMRARAPYPSGRTVRDVGTIVCPHRAQAGIFASILRASALAEVIREISSSR
jgi:hypothetical protein